jgi:hypothetical protein
MLLNFTNGLVRKQFYCKLQTSNKTLIFEIKYEEFIQNNTVFT